MDKMIGIVKSTQAFFDALELLFQHAKSDTGGSRRCAAFLLSLWDGNEFKVDLQALLYIDTAIHEAMIIVFRHLHVSNNQLYTYVNQAQMAPVIDVWGEVFRYPNHPRRCR